MEALDLDAKESQYSVDPNVDCIRNFDVFAANSYTSSALGDGIANLGSSGRGEEEGSGCSN